MTTNVNGTYCQTCTCMLSVMEVAMTANWTRIKLPPLERVALAGLAEKRGEPDDATLVRLIREAVRRELIDDGLVQRSHEGEAVYQSEGATS